MRRSPHAKIQYPVTADGIGEPVSISALPEEGWLAVGLGASFLLILRLLSRSFI